MCNDVVRTRTDDSYTMFEISDRHLFVIWVFHSRCCYAIIRALFRADYYRIFCISNHNKCTCCINLLYRSGITKSISLAQSSV